MMISDKHRFAYTGITKTATQSMYDVLARHYMGYRPAGYGHHDLCVPAHAQEYFRFAVVRNPYDRAVSMWWSTCKRDGDKYGFRAACPDPDNFGAFMRWVVETRPDSELTRTQADHLRAVPVNKTLRFESLADDFKTLPFYNGDPAEWPRINTTVESRGHWSRYMNAESVEMVNRWCPCDFDRFGYKRIDWDDDGQVES